MSGLNDDTISTIEDIEAQGLEYQQQAQDLAIDMGSREPEAYHYDMNQLDTNNQTLSYYALTIYNYLDRVHSFFGPFSDRRFILRSHLKSWVAAHMYKMEEIKFTLALNNLVKQGRVEKKMVTDHEDGEVYTETYYGIA